MILNKKKKNNIYRLKQIDSHVKQGSYEKMLFFFMFNHMYHQLQNTMFKLILEFFKRAPSTKSENDS